MPPINSHAYASNLWYYPHGYLQELTITQQKQILPARDNLLQASRGLGGPVPAGLTCVSLREAILASTYV